MKIELPQVGESVTEGVIGKWLKNIGDNVEKFDPLVEVVTDKVNMELPSPVTGTLKEIMAREGETVPMGAIIAEIEVEDDQDIEEQPDQRTEQTESPSADIPVGKIGELLKDVSPVGPTGSGGPLNRTDELISPATEKPVEPQQTASKRHVYSPAVLRLSENHQVDLDNIKGTGINGRVTRKDVQNYLQSSIPPDNLTVNSTHDESLGEITSEPNGDEQRIPITPIRKIIADNMVKSATLIPQAWGQTEVDVTNLVKRRNTLKEPFKEREGITLTYLPFVIKAVSESLKEIPLMNSSWGNDSIILKKRIHINIAIAAPDGLVVPVIKDADTLSISGLAKRLNELITKARERNLAMEDVQGGTFTVNNTGALGTTSSVPLVNYPQAGILTTEAIIKRPVIIDDAIATRSMMNICLSFDHRIMDGQEATGFNMSVRKKLESISSNTPVY